MKKIINNILIALFILAGNTVFGQSLQEIINRTLEENYNILIERNDAEIAANNNTLGNAGLLPTIDLNGNASRSYNNTLQKFADGTIREGTNAKVTNYGASALANWTVFDGFRVHARFDELESLQRLGEVDAKFYIEQTVADIAVAYYQLLREHKLLNNYSKSLEISEYRLQIEAKRREVGSGKGIDYHQAVVDFQTDSIRVIGQLNAIKSLEIEINRIMNGDLETEINQADSTFTVLSLPAKDSLFNLSAKNNKQLQQQRLQELIAEAAVRIEKSDRYPQLDVFAGYQYNRSLQEVGFVNSTRNFGPTIGVTVNFNLYNGGNTNREVRNALINSESTTYQRKQVELNVNADLLDYYYQYLSVRQRVTLAEGNLESATKVYRIADEQLKRGAINGYDFRLTQLTLINAANTLLELEFSLKVLEINMHRMSGTILEAYL